MTMRFDRAPDKNLATLRSVNRTLSHSYLSLMYKSNVFTYIILLLEQLQHMEDRLRKRIIVMNGIVNEVSFDAHFKDYVRRLV